MKNRLFLLLTCLICCLSVAYAGSPVTGEDLGAPEAMPLQTTTLIEITNPDTINICLGDTVFFEQTNNVNNEGLRWRTTAGFLDDDTTANPRAIPPFSRYYVVEVGPVGGPFDVDSVYVDVDVFAVPELIDSGLYCQNTPLLLIKDSVRNVGNTLYNWTPGTLLDDSTDVNAVYFPEQFVDTTFTLISTAANGACADTQSVRVDLIEAVLDLNRPDTIKACLGDGPITLSAQISPSADGDITFSPLTFGVEAPDGASFVIEPRGNVQYFVSAIVNGCPLADSVTVRVDSLPENTEMTLDPVKDPYCIGDTFFVRSPTYEPSEYTLITHRWDVAPGLASPTNLYNGVFFAADSALLERVTINGGCMRLDTLQVNVIQPPTLIFDPDPAVVCPGEELQINVSFAPSGPRGELEWEDPSNTLSCDDCLDPVATVNETTTYNIEVTAEGSECTSPAMYTVSIQEDSRPDIPSGPSICSGESLRLITGGISNNSTYRIQGPGVDSNDPTIEVTPPADGTEYTITTTGSCGEIVDVVRVSFVDNYTLTASGPGPICIGEEAQLTAQLSNGTSGTFTWTLPDGSAQQGLQITVSPETTQTYTVVFADDRGCGTATAQVTVEVVGAQFEPAIVATTASGAILMNGDTVFAGATVTLAAANIPAGLNVTYDWMGNFDPETGNEATLEVMAPREDGNDLDYNLIVSTVDGGCEFEADIRLTYVEAEVRIPELVTPNGDGVNEVFRLYYGGDITDYNLAIYNRWGQRIFESTDVDQGWDGTKDGTPQNTDMYLYLAKFTINGLEVTREGEFHLVR